MADADLTHVSDAAIAAVAREVTGDPAAVQALWASLRARLPGLTVRADIESDFLVAALRSARGEGLLDEVLDRLQSEGLTSGATFIDVARTTLGFVPAGARVVETGGVMPADLLAMSYAAAAQLNGSALPPMVVEPRYQPFLARSADESILGSAAARDRTCSIFVDGVLRGSGVLLHGAVVATSSHVVASLVDPSPDDGFAAKDGSIARLELYFPRAIGDGPGRIAPLARDWLAFFSPTAPCECAQPFDVYDVTGIDGQTGPWDIAVIRLAEPPATAGQGRQWCARETPDFRFDITVLHCPPGLGRGGSGVYLSPGAYLGRLSAASAIRLFHDAQTSGGSSGAPCFNSNWEVVAIHQGGALVPGANGKVNRAVPIGPWIASVPESMAPPPVAWQRSVPAIDGVVPQPVIGRRPLQRRIAAAKLPDATAAERLFVQNGSKGRGKSFSMRLLGPVREQGHTLAVLDLESMEDVDDAGFAERLLGALGVVDVSPAQPGLSRREREVRNTTLPDLVAKLTHAARDRPLWLALDGFAGAGLLENAGIAQLIDGLICELPRMPQLRLMLTDWTRPLPPGYSGCAEDLDQPEAWPRLDDFVDYVELLLVPPGETLHAQKRALIGQMLEPALAPLFGQPPVDDPHFYRGLLAAADPALTVLKTLVR